MNIYSFPYSLPSYRARLAASMLGLSFETVNVDLMAGEHKSQDYLDINSLGKIPALTDNYRGKLLTVTDSIAILRYLARLSDNDAAYPESELDTAAKIDVYLSMVANELFDSVETGRIIKTFKMKDESEYPACSGLAYELFEQLDKDLAQSKYLVSDQMTIADIAVLSTLIYFGEAGLSLDNYPNIERWMKDMKATNGYISPVLMQD
ncbi:glutathione S-transferase family protein [Vibrio mediterranei]